MRPSIVLLPLLFIGLDGRSQDGSVITPPAYSTSLNNYICTWAAVKPDTTAADFTTTTALAHSRMTTQYYDGLGRPIELVNREGSLSSGGSAVDLVLAQVYDAYGREQRKYLPFGANTYGGNSSVTDGGFKTNPFQEQQSFYSGASSPIAGQNQNYYYSKSEFEPSPLDRVVGSYAAGDSWVHAGNGTTTGYWVNTATDSVWIWQVNNSGVVGVFGSYSATSLYPPGELYKTIVADESGKQLIEFKDREGNVVLKKAQLTATADNGSGAGYSGWLSTYYVYDSLNLLRAVIQPAGVQALQVNGWNISSGTILQEQCFRYEYDGRRHNILKQVPGAAPVWMVYDQWDRLVLTADSNLRAQHEWLYTKYDALDRPVITGFYTDNANTTLVAEINNLKTLNLGRYETFNNSSYPEYSLTSSFPSVTSSTVLTYTYYDNHLWTSWYGADNTRDNSLDGYTQTPSNTTFPYPQPIHELTTPVGKVTGVWQATGAGLLDDMFYDSLYRVIQVRQYNYTGGTSETTTQYSFTGQPLVSVTSSPKNLTNPQTTLIVTQQTYDSLGRLTQIQKKVSNTTVNSGTLPSAWETIAQYSYDALGRMSARNLGQKPGFAAGTPLAKLNYVYNIRGWLLSINQPYVDASTNSDQYFGLELGYDANASLGTFTPQYNGNIAGMLWKGEGDQAVRKYDFTYDDAARLLGANFNQYVSGSGTTATFDKSAGIDYTVSGLNYDANGNILGMLQKGWKINSSQTIDSLSYSYLSSGNKLAAVTDGITDTTVHLGDFTNGTNTGNDYAYDGNGNLTVDSNKNINCIHYNYLNLPDSIHFLARGYIRYLYDTRGNKIKKIVVDSTLSPAKNDTTLYLDGAQYLNDTLQFIGTEEGRLRLDTTGGSALVYDYFLKDHLGNTRTVLTEQEETDRYPVASLETANLANESLYYAGEDTGRVSTNSVAGYPNDPTTNPNNYTQGLSGGSGQPTIGTNIVLKVMAGDTVNIRATSWYNNYGASPGAPASPLASLLLGLAGGVVATNPGHYMESTLQQSGGLNPGVTNFLNHVDSNFISTKPKAFLNWILLDEQFRYVAGGTNTNSGFIQVGADTILTPLMVNGQIMTRSGYLFIYVSNQTSNIIVYFDNLQVTHIRGRIMEETNYYPFGLTMAGISSEEAGKPENQLKFNGKELQHQEFSNGTGLEWYDYGARMYDAQLGRWHVPDLKAETNAASGPYVYATNNPIRYIDPNGMIWEDPNQADQLRLSVFNELISQVMHQQQVAQDLYDNDSQLSDKQKENLQNDLDETSNRIDQLSTSIADIARLGDDQLNTYRLVSIDDPTSYVSKGEDGIINIAGSSSALDAMHLHEIRHVSEALTSTNGLEWTSGGMLRYEPQDALPRETSAYRAQYSYYPGSLSNIRSMKQINERFLGTMVDADGQALYPVIAQDWNNLPKFVQDLIP